MNRVTCPYCDRTGIEARANLNQQSTDLVCPECGLVFEVRTNVSLTARALPESERRRPVPMPPPAWPVPDSNHWIRLYDGSQWVTDGACALRGNCPALPSGWHALPSGWGDRKGWHEANPTLRTAIEELLDAGRARYPDFAAGRFHPRFAAILQTTEPVEGSIARAVDGQIVAFIMPLSRHFIHAESVDNRGQA